MRLRFRFDFIEQVVVTLDVGPAGGSHLDKRKLLLKGRVLFQQPLNRQKSLGYSLGVIHPVHSHTHEDGFYAMFL